MDFGYKQGNAADPLVLGLSLGIGNNETAENKSKKKPERGQYNQDGKQGKRSWKRQPDLETENVYISVDFSSLKENGKLSEGRNLHVSQQSCMRQSSNQRYHSMWACLQISIAKMAICCHRLLLIQRRCH